MRLLVASLLVAANLSCSISDVDLGAVDRERQPSLDQLREPRDDKAVPRVGLRERVTGQVKLTRAKNLYVLVNPLSNPTTSRNTWWVQERVSVDGDRFSAVCQFGEPGEGQHEYFAIAAVECDATYDVGQMLNALPRGKAWSAFKIVKRD